MDQHSLGMSFSLFCVLMIYCALNVNTFKLFLKVHIALVYRFLFLLLVIIGFDNSFGVFFLRLKVNKIFTTIVITSPGLFLIFK